nr:MAG TPA: hypothetical protein [Caudoviricetes sp.]
MFAVLFGFRVHCIIKPFFQSPKLFAKKILDRLKNPLFPNMERTRARKECKLLNIN